MTYTPPLPSARSLATETPVAIVAYVVSFSVSLSPWFAKKYGTLARSSLGELRSKHALFVVRRKGTFCWASTYSC